MYILGYFKDIWTLPNGSFLLSGISWHFHPQCMNIHIGFSIRLLKDLNNVTAEKLYPIDILIIYLLAK